MSSAEITIMSGVTQNVTPAKSKDTNTTPS